MCVCFKHLTPLFVFSALAFRYFLSGFRLDNLHWDNGAIL